MVKSGTFSIIYAALLSMTKIIGVFQAMPFDKELRSDPVSIKQHIQRFEHLTYSFVACRPELDDGIFTFERTFKRVLEYRILIIIPVKDICFFPFRIKLLAILIKFKSFHDGHLAVRL